MKATGIFSAVRRLFFMTVGDVLAIVQAVGKVVVYGLFFYIGLKILGNLIGIGLQLSNVDVGLRTRNFVEGVLVYSCLILAWWAVKKLPIWGWKDGFLRNKRLTSDADTEGIARRKESSNTTFGDVVAWVFAYVFVLSFSALALGIFVFDTFLTRYFLDAITMLGHILSCASGVHFPVVAVGSLYVLDALCLASFLCLFIPVLRHKRGTASSVYTISGVSCILFYTFGFVSSNFWFFIDLIGHSVTGQYRYLILRSLALEQGGSMAYGLVHAYILPPLMALSLNAILLVVLFRYNRTAPLAETEEKSKEELAAPERTLRSMRTDRRGDAKWFRCLTELYISKSGASNYLLYFHLDGYSPKAIANMTDKDIEDVIDSGHVVRSLKRMETVRQNAKIFCGLIEEFGSFRSYVISITQVGDKRRLTLDEVNVAAMVVANDMRHRGFKQIGPVTAVELIAKMFRVTLPKNHFGIFQDFFNKRR